MRITDLDSRRPEGSGQTFDEILVQGRCLSVSDAVDLALTVASAAQDTT